MVGVREFGAGAIALVVMLALLNGVFTVAADTSDPVQKQEDVLLTDGTGELSWDASVRNFSANQTLGTSVAFTGANDSKLKGSATAAHDQTWTVSTWVEADEVRTQRAVQFGGWFMLDLVNNSGNATWRVTYYDDADWKTYNLSAPASSPTTMTNVVVTANESVLTISENNTQIASTDLADASGAPVPQNVSNFDGRLEETRVLDDVVTSNQKQTLYVEPTAPVRANETARIYFDARAGETTIDVYRTGADLTLSNATVVDGFEGQDLESAGLLGNGDYRRNGDTVIAVDGGNLDGAPVVFVDYDGVGGRFFNLSQVSGPISGAMGLIALALVVGAARFVLEQLDDSGGGL